MRHYKGVRVGITQFELYSLRTTEHFGSNSDALSARHVQLCHMYTTESPAAYQRSKVDPGPGHFPLVSIGYLLLLRIEGHVNGLILGDLRSLSLTDVKGRSPRN